MLSQYQATIPPESNNSKELKKLNQEMMTTEARISDNCQSIAILKNNNRILENHIQTLLKKMDRIEENVKYEKMGRDLEDAIIIASAPVRIPGGKL